LNSEFKTQNSKLAILGVSLLTILFVGDIVGRPGRRILKALLTELRRTETVDLVIANGENSAGGFGISMEVCQELLTAGVDVITLGNHTWDNREVSKVLEQERRVIRPANYPNGTPGEGSYIVETDRGIRVGIINVLGLVFLEPLSCPFLTVDYYLDSIRKKTPYVIVDFHAEATSEKMALGWYLDGRVSAVIGTHTHIATADERILPKGTGYITDVGMTGPKNSVLGIDPHLVITKFLTKRPVKFELASGPIQFNAVILKIDENGLTTSIKRIYREIS
jgi:2',3'-cyclic-nucleotide 2'-phosphodiesterase